MLDEYRRQKAQLVNPAERRAAAEDIIAMALNGAENFHPAAAKEFDVEPQPPVHHLRQRQTRSEERRVGKECRL